MDSAFDNLDAMGFLEIWQHFDEDGKTTFVLFFQIPNKSPLNVTGLFSTFILTDNGYIEGKELDEFFRHMMKKLSPQVIINQRDFVFFKNHCRFD